MYYILRDTNTGSWYMKPNQFCFHAYTDSMPHGDLPSGVKSVEIAADSKKELTSMLFRAGFVRGYLNDKLILLTNKDSDYCMQNPNEIAYAQYLLTGRIDYVETLLEKSELITLCKIKADEVYFPTIEYESERVVLAYTDIVRIPKQLFEKYPDYYPVKMTFDAKCIVNDKFIIE